jgi:hypothetical protein
MKVVNMYDCSIVYVLYYIAAVWLKHQSGIKNQFRQ